jgi:hypothetical protein
VAPRLKATNHETEIEHNESQTGDISHLPRLPAGWFTPTRFAEADRTHQDYSKLHGRLAATSLWHEKTLLDVTFSAESAP